jgi:hypothetical protein
MPERTLLHILVVACLAMGLLGLHGWLGASVIWLLLTLPVALAVGTGALVAGLITGSVVQRQGTWWPRRSPGLGQQGLAELGWHARDLVDFLDTHWVLGALVLGACTLTLPLAPFCFLAWWVGVCRAAS